MSGASSLNKQTYNLCDINLAGELYLLLDEFGELNGEHAMLDLGLDIFLLYIVRQNQRLLKL